MTVFASTEAQQLPCDEQRDAGRAYFGDGDLGAGQAVKSALT